MYSTIHCKLDSHAVPRVPAFRNGPRGGVGRRPEAGVAHAEADVVGEWDGRADAPRGCWRYTGPWRWNALRAGAGGALEDGAMSLSHVGVLWVAHSLCACPLLLTWRLPIPLPPLLRLPFPYSFKSWALCQQLAYTQQHNYSQVHLKWLLAHCLVSQSHSTAAKSIYKVLAFSIPCVQFTSVGPSLEYWVERSCSLLSTCTDSLLCNSCKCRTPFWVSLRY